MKRPVYILFGVVALALATLGSPAVAQDNYPSLPIRLVLGVAPGATTDLVARLLAQRLSVQMNTSVVVDNKPGANGSIGAEFAAKSKPDGYTLLLNTPTLVLNRALGEKLGYDLFKDLAPVALVAYAPYLLIVHPSVPANTVAEFITYVRASPDKLTYGSGGTGSINHLGPLLLLQANGLSALHVPYKVAAAATTDLVAGRLQFRFADLGESIPLMKDKRIRALAITGLKRSPQLPDVPTIAESGMPGFEVVSWFGVMVPAKTPPTIVKRLNAEIMKAIPDMKPGLAQNDAEALGSTPEEYGAYISSQLERWTKIIKSANIKLE